MSVRFLLFVVFVFGAQGIPLERWDFSNTTVLTAENFYTRSDTWNGTQPLNFFEEVTITINHKKTLDVCIQLGDQLPFNYKDCTIYERVTSSGSSTSGNTTGFTSSLEGLESTLAFSLGAQRFVMGVKLANPKDAKDEITIKGTGLYCPVGNIVKDSKCAEATSLKPKQQLHFPAAEVQYFKFQLPELVSVLNIATAEFAFAKGAELQYCVRREGIPSFAESGSEQICDNTDITSVQVASPLPGSWYLAVRSVVAGSYNVSMTAPVCNSGAGVNCATEILEAKANMTVVIGLEGEWIFYEISVDPNVTSQVNVSLASEGPYHPEVYLSQGNIPTKNSAFIKGCTAKVCKINIIKYNTTFNDKNSDELWYVGILSTNPANDTEFGIWFNGNCAPQCDLHGNCNEDDQTCKCVANWVGYDCATEGDGLGPQYIVLIIIASLVVASAVIGFIAWAYMKKKRSGYSAV